MRAPRWLALPALLTLASLGLADLPKGWQWTTEYPFRGLATSASSEQADRWPASNAIDGDTSEPDGLWQTLRDSPQTAWLELRLERPRRVVGVSIYHQDNPRYYRSVDYSIECRVGPDWHRVADVTGNKAAGWREHPFDAVETDAVRLSIGKSEYGFRMGLNEARLVLLPEEGGEATRVSEPRRCGPVADMGVITFQAELPEGASVELSTRTAPDDGGEPGEWSAWSAAYEISGDTIVSPPGEWVQYRAVHHGSTKGEPILSRVTLGSPECLAGLDGDAIIARPGEPLRLTARFSTPMRRGTPPVCRVGLPNQNSLLVEGGQWDRRAQTWVFPPLMLPEAEGVGVLRVGGAARPDGLLMLDEAYPLVVGTGAVLERLRGIAEWMMENEQAAIFVEGYNERTLLALFEITGEQRYLDHVRRWARKLLGSQKPEGYWGTGYGDVYFADTGSALGLLINLCKFADATERARIDAALERYIDLLLVRGDSTGRSFVHEDGSVGVGYHADIDGNIKSDLNSPYTIATALTGAEIFGAWYYMKGDEQHRQIAINACDWVLDTMVGEEPLDAWAAPGQIPYYIDDWNKGRTDREWIWKRWPYDTSAYAGEGFIAAWTYIDDEDFREELGERVRPHIEWLLRTQNDDGSWAVKGSGDQLRSHGVVNLLLWYHESIDQDPRVAAAVSRYVRLLLDEERSAYLKAPGDGIATSLVGRALVEVVRPGVDCYRWKGGE